MNQFNRASDVLAEFQYFGGCLDFHDGRAGFTVRNVFVLAPLCVQPPDKAADKLVVFCMSSYGQSGFLYLLLFTVHLIIVGAGQTLKLCLTPLRRIV